MKRFIAGAECPKCHLIDKIFVYQIDKLEFCECNRCGFKQEQAMAAQPAIAKIGKREQIVRIIRPQGRVNK